MLQEAQAETKKGVCGYAVSCCILLLYLSYLEYITSTQYGAYCEVYLWFTTGRNKTIVSCMLSKSRLHTLCCSLCLRARKVLGAGLAIKCSCFMVRLLLETYDITILNLRFVDPTVTQCVMAHHSWATLRELTHVLYIYSTQP